MSYSLNEVEAMAKKAVRGAGYSWGLAEEAGKTVSWLCRHNVDGCAALVRHLDQLQTVNLPLMTPQIESGEWTCAGGMLCPLITGSTLSDYAHILRNGPIGLQRIAEPSLLLYGAAMTARQLNMAVKLLWSETIAVTDGVRLSVEGNTNSPMQRVVVASSAMPGRLNKFCERASPTDCTWKALNRFAFRTYAPATEESRISGAGAGLSDND